MHENGKDLRAKLVVSREKSDPSNTRQIATILIADDEDVVRNFTADFLERLGYNVLTAANGRECVDLFNEHENDIACVLLDLTMPKMSGEACFDELYRIRDDVKIILMSGFTELEVADRFSGRELAGFLQKPYQPIALQEKLEEILSD